MASSAKRTSRKKSDAAEAAVSAEIEMTAAEIQELQDNGTLSPPLTYFFTKVHHKGY